ncbi:MAG: glucosaminidase domain-containing protein [Candidatus Azobacteroides sp.]|nr:glucosaminidase domain-containing protein [Candidatus Azobacteroides sp.]
MRIHLYLFLFFCFLLGFNFTLPAQRKLQVNIDYINKYSDIAVKHRNKYKIPASITLAQGIIESGAGLSELARASNNHFGIKCHSDWTGERVYRQDDGPNDCFRKYKTVEDSYEDHAKFLRQYSRYAVLFTYDIRDYTAWAKGLQTCGYATDRGYANKLIQMIEAYELYKYDEKAAPKSTTQKAKEKKKKKTPVLLRDVYRTYNLIYVIAKANDSFDQIADDTGFKVKDLIKYNEVPEDFPLEKGDIVYLEKKKKKADKPYFEHLVKIGESMHSISQRYGIQMKHLYKMNKKDSDYVPTEGDVLRLR